MKIVQAISVKETAPQTMHFLSSLQPRQIFFYLTIVCNLATCSFNATANDDETRLVSGCRYNYPNYVTPYVISCRNMYVNEIPSHDNVTKMELMNVPLAVLNDTLIPRAIQSDHVNLRQLHWTKSHITVLEKISIANLNELDLSWNIIQDVRPNAIRQLLQLKKFNISHNNIERMPTNLMDEHNSLTILSLSHNLLKNLPRTFFEALTHLEILDMSNNLLSHLTEVLFRRNSRLQNLNLSHNKISSLPGKIFFSLSNLQYLSLYDNHLFMLEVDTFMKLHQLMVLNIGKNPFWSLPHTLLPNNNTLFILTISHTRLRKVKLTALQNLQSLRSLQLTNNVDLQNLPNDTFQNLHNLGTISLENNNFTQLPYSIIDTKLVDLYLDGNPWPCDCSIQWIIFWMISVNGGRKNNLHLNSKCNATNQDLLQTLLELQCKPNIISLSPFSYQKLDSSVRLSCRSYANPAPSISWFTPSGFAYLEASSEDANDASQYQSVALVDNYQHSQTINRKVRLYQIGDLDIEHMSRDDAGEYTCIASNKVGESLATTRLYADPSVMERIKIGSMICGFLWVNTFIVFSVFYILVRRYSKRTKREKRTQRMQKNMDVYKLQQISRLRERCKNQMNRIKNNCSIQVDWMKENYKESISSSQDHRVSYLTNQYNEQMSEIREYYLTQMQKVREHYDQQRNLIMEFSINRVAVCVGDEEAKARPSPVDGASLVKLENGSAAQASVPATEEEEIYKYNETMKNEIQMLTSLRNLHDIFAENQKRPPNGIQFDDDRPNERPVVSNGKLRPPEEEGDENTSMLSGTP